MLSSDNLNIQSRDVLSTPGSIRSELPLSLESVHRVLGARKEIQDILDGKSRRLMVIVGPCSIHNPEGALEYAQKLKTLAEEVRDRVMVIMRV